MSGCSGGASINHIIYRPRILTLPSCPVSLYCTGWVCVLPLPANNPWKRKQRKLRRNRRRRSGTVARSSKSDLQASGSKSPRLCSSSILLYRIVLHLSSLSTTIVTSTTTLHSHLHHYDTLRHYHYYRTTETTLLLSNVLKKNTPTVRRVVLTNSPLGTRT